MIRILCHFLINILQWQTDTTLVRSIFASFTPCLLNHHGNVNFPEEKKSDKNTSYHSHNFCHILTKKNMANKSKNERQYPISFCRKRCIVWQTKMQHASSKNEIVMILQEWILRLYFYQNGFDKACQSLKRLFNGIVLRRKLVAVRTSTERIAF